VLIRCRYLNQSAPESKDIHLEAHGPSFSALVSVETLKFFTVTLGQGRESFLRSPEISGLGHIYKDALRK